MAEKERDTVVSIEQARAERSIANDPVEQRVTIEWHRDAYNLHFVDHLTETVGDWELRWLADQFRYIAGRIEEDLP